MQFSNLYVPERSNFLNHVASSIDFKAEKKPNGKIASLMQRMFRLPENRQVQNDDHFNMSPVENLKYHILLSNLHKSPRDIQQIIMSQAKGFECWLTMKSYCQDEAIDHYAKKTLVDLNKKYYFGNPIEILIRHTFRELVLNSNIKQINSLIEQFNKEESIINNAKTKFQIICEKVIHCVANIFRIGGILVGIYVGLNIFFREEALTNFLEVKCFPIVANKIVNYVHPKMIKVTSQILDKAFYATILYIVCGYTRLNQYPLLMRSINLIEKVVNFPRRFSFILRQPLAMAYVVYQKITKTTNTASHLMKQGVSQLEGFRLQQQLQSAENLFVKQIMNLKVKRV